MYKIVKGKLLLLLPLQTRALHNASWPCSKEFCVPADSNVL